jgi:hypothetical protein
MIKPSSQMRTLLLFVVLSTFSIKARAGNCDLELLTTSIYQIDSLFNEFESTVERNDLNNAKIEFEKIKTFIDTILTPPLSEERVFYLEIQRRIKISIGKLQSVKDKDFDDLKRFRITFNKKYSRRAQSFNRIFPISKKIRIYSQILKIGTQEAIELQKIIDSLKLYFVEISQSTPGVDPK